MKKNVLYPILSTVLAVFIVWLASQVVIVKVNQAVMAEQISNIKEDVSYTREWIDKIRVGDEHTIDPSPTKLVQREGP